VLFLLTSGVNVITLGLAGLALFIGVVPGPNDLLLSALPAAVGFGVLAFFLALPRLAGGRIAQRAPSRVTMLMEASVQSVRDTRKLLFTPDWRLSGAYAFLWCDIGVLVVCFAATGHSPPLASIVLAYQIGYLANIIPIPGGIGVLDGSMIGMLVLYGVNAKDATAATVVYHAIALWVPAVWGSIAFVVLRLTKNKPLTLRPTLAERRQLRAERRRERRGEREGTGTGQR
jgi:uncharacterized membrane protein YbhN (UPF0104 family)